MKEVVDVEAALKAAEVELVAAVQVAVET